MNPTGLFVTFEGIDRSGKSTQARLLAESLGPDCVAVREPGGTPLGERIREVLKDPRSEPSPRAEALLFAAARAELATQVIAPALASGRKVVCDRFLDSSLAYQGAARGVGLDVVRAINEPVLNGLSPDLTFLLDLDPDAAVDRSGALDRFESEGLGLQAKVREAYRALAASEPARWAVIDASEKERTIHEQVLETVRARRGG